MQALGFIINWDKSELTPTQCPNRATIDIPRQLARPSQRRIATLWRSARLLRGRRQAPAKTWLQFRGFLSRLVDVRPDCRLLMRPLQLFFSGITNRAGTPYPDGSPCPDDPPPLPEVEPSGIPAHGQPIEGPQPTITVTTDASHTGWGSLPGPHCLWGLVPLQGTPPYQCAGVSGCLLSLHHFLPLVRHRTVLILEFQAVFLSLHHFLPLVRHRTVLIRTDNVTVAAYINKQGCTHTPHAWTP